jgi:hypothetical protein
VNKRCFTSSAPWKQIGHCPDVPTCLFTKIDFRGSEPCRAFQQKIFTLLGTFIFHKFFQTGLELEGEPCPVLGPLQHIELQIDDLDHVRPLTRSNNEAHEEKRTI